MKTIYIYYSKKEIKKIEKKINYKEEIIGYNIIPDLYNSLTKYNDDYFILRDFNSYKSAQEKVNNIYRDFNKWNQISLVNIAKSGRFSSDDTIKRYANEIWNIKTID